VTNAVTATSNQSPGFFGWNLISLSAQLGYILILGNDSLPETVKLVRKSKRKLKLRSGEYVDMKKFRVKQEYKQVNHAKLCV